MNRLHNFLDQLHPYLLSSIASVLTLAQIILAFIYHGPDSTAWELAGWILLWTAGIFGTLPILIFRRRGQVPKGKSYIKTTVLVDSGLYAIVRHPQNGTAWLLINLGVILIARHWTSVILGVISMILVYADSYKEDERCIEKFGDAYQEYMKRVPAVNPIRGAFRLAFRPNRA